MTGEKDPRDVMQAEHDARLSEHPAFQAPAEMPGGERACLRLFKQQKTRGATWAKTNGLVHDIKDFILPTGGDVKYLI